MEHVGITRVVCTAFWKFELPSPGASPRRRCCARLVRPAVGNEIVVFESVQLRLVVDWNSHARILDREHVVVVRRLEVFADVDLQRRLAVAEDVVRGAHARRDVVVAGHTVGPREGERRRRNCDAARTPFSPSGNQLHACS